MPKCFRKFTYAEILKMKEEYSDDFSLHISCADCPCENNCNGDTCLETLSSWLETHTENNADISKKLYVIDNGVESHVVELTTEQEKFLKWLDGHNYFVNSPKEYTEPEVYKI